MLANPGKRLYIYNFDQELFMRTIFEFWFLIIC